MNNQNIAQLRRIASLNHKIISPMLACTEVPYYPMVDCRINRTFVASLYRIKH